MSLSFYVLRTGCCLMVVVIRYLRIPTTPARTAYAKYDAKAFFKLRERAAGAFRTSPPSQCSMTMLTASPSSYLASTQGST